MNEIHGDRFYHREMIEPCPHCDVEFCNDIWMENIVEVRPNHFRFPHEGATTAISECPNCHELSWLHVTRFHKLPEQFKQIAYDLREIF